MRPKSNARAPWGLAAIMLLGLGGCGTLRPPELDVEHQWSDAMRRLGMFGFYPATEDVQPGDVYIKVPPPSGALAWAGRTIEPALIPWSRPDHDGGRFSVLRIGTLAPMRPDQPRRRPAGQSMTIRDALEEQQDERLRIEPLPVSDPPGAEQEQRPATRAAPPRRLGGETQGNYNIGHADQATRPVRLRRSAIPALTVARVSEAQLSAAGILGNIGANLGLSRGAETGLTIALHDIQELSLDAARADRLFRGAAPDFFNANAEPEALFRWLSYLRGGPRYLYDLTQSACEGDADTLRRQGVEVAVVTRVIYAGRIEFSFSSRIETALRAAADLQNTLAREIRQAPQIPSFTVITTSGAGASSPSNGAAAGQAGANGGQAGGSAAEGTPANLRNAIVSRLAGLSGLPGGAGARAGVTTSIGVGSFGSLALSQTFNRPIAVGAGSRLRIGFHQALAGIEASDSPGPDSARMIDRFQQAAAYCADFYRARGHAALDWTRPYAGQQRLWNAMGGSGQHPPLDGAPSGDPLPAGVSGLAPGRMLAPTGPRSSPPATRQILRIP